MDYEVMGAYALKIVGGVIVRQPGTFSITLHTPEGVMRFLEEAAPVNNVVVRDATTKEDLTEEFV